MCYVDAVVTVGGYTRYNMGCRDSQHCQSFAEMRDSDTNMNMNIHKETTGTDAPELMETMGDVVCSECCNGSICNSKGCATQGYPIQRGPICWNCHVQQGHSDCSTITMCQESEVCVLRQTNHTMMHLIRYETGCEHSSICTDKTEEIHPVEHSLPIIGRRMLVPTKKAATTTCQTHCCETDLCNNNCVTGSSTPPTIPVHKTTTTTSSFTTTEEVDTKAPTRPDTTVTTPPTTVTQSTISTTLATPQTTIRSSTSSTVTTLITTTKSPTTLTVTTPQTTTRLSTSSTETTPQTTTKSPISTTLTTPQTTTRSPTSSTVTTPQTTTKSSTTSTVTTPQTTTKSSTSSTVTTPITATKPPTTSTVTTPQTTTKSPTSTSKITTIQSSTASILTTPSSTTTEAPFINQCFSNPCVGGTCAKFADTYTCVCFHGYYGRNCENIVPTLAPSTSTSSPTDTPCHSDVCVNGRCVVKQASVQCECDRGYMGQTCDIPVVCPSDFTKYYEKCYNVLRDRPRTYSEAELACSKYNAHLAMIKTNYDMLGVFNACFSNRTHGFWIGANDRLAEGDFRWVDNTRVTDGVQYWSNTTITNRPGNCVELIMARAFEWFATDCAAMKIAICEYP